MLTDSHGPDRNSGEQQKSQVTSAERSHWEFLVPLALNSNDPDTHTTSRPGQVVFGGSRESRAACTIGLPLNLDRCPATKAQPPTAAYDCLLCRLSLLCYLKEGQNIRHPLSIRPYAFSLNAIRRQAEVPCLPKVCYGPQKGNRIPNTTAVDIYQMCKVKVISSNCSRQASMLHTAGLVPHQWSLVE